METIGLLLEAHRESFPGFDYALSSAPLFISPKNSSFVAKTEGRAAGVYRA